MKKDFERDLTRFESELPTDKSGVDVPLILDLMRTEVRDIPGFEVVEESALGTFSFAKYLMWKDLVDRGDQLEKNRVVRHLIQDPEKPFDSGCGTIPEPREIDQRYTPREIFHPLPADSSQLAAVMAASEGHDFVLVGPPGTGKSQTIANIISQCLATEKSVLFVAEKTAALDVVFRRLREQGLGDCCLELHSNKAERKQFLDQLGASWNHNRRASQNDWLTISERLKIRRDELNAYVEAIHRQYPNGWNAYRALGLCVRGAEWKSPKLNWPTSVQHDRETYQNLERMIQTLGSTYDVIDPSKSLSMIRHADWSVTWESNLLSQCSNLMQVAKSFQNTLSKITDTIGVSDADDCTLLQWKRMQRLATALIESEGEETGILYEKQFSKFSNALNELEEAVSNYQKARGQSSADYEESLDSIPVEQIVQQWRQAITSVWPLSWFAKRKVKRFLQSYATNGATSVGDDLRSIQLMQEQRKLILENVLAEKSHYWKAHETDIRLLREQITKVGELRSSIISLSDAFGLANEISKKLHPVLTGESEWQPVLSIAEVFLKESEEFRQALNLFAEVAGAELIDDQGAIVDVSVEACLRIEEHKRQIQSWTAWCEVKQKANASGLNVFVSALEHQALNSENLLERFRLSYARWWIAGVIDGDEVLRTFQRFKQEEAISDFGKLDDLARATAVSRAKASVAHNLPSEDAVPRKSELGLLRHQMNLKRPSKSIRDVISGMQDYFGMLAPCVLMSPLSIAQYLPAGQALFDVVIFDEASQITTWDAIGAIARGKQTIIVGDPKQLPPTNFFGRTDDDGSNDELDDHEKDLESILDEAKAAGLPTLMLNWHYRSRHESLIAFSNWNYCGNELVTFPAAESENRGVSFRYLPEAIYDRGKNKSKTNRQEATAIVADAVERMKQSLSLPEEQRLTFGVITFNSQQQSLIQDLLDAAQRNNPELDWYFSDERIEPTVVKNLENVQGDERDVMFFSITFGRDASGREISRNFGALNRSGGERRLNVAITRARQELIVYSSFKGEELRIEGINARGVKDLKNFLEYAEKGAEAVLSRADGSVGGFDSPFEEAVAELISAKGWSVVPQVGVSGFRIDLGVVHPDKPGSFLAGIECDGATYHRSAAARDRDKTRQLVLENLGWNILRVWSRDWWYDSQNAADLIDQELYELLSVDRGDADENDSDASFESRSLQEPLIAKRVQESFEPKTASAVLEETEIVFECLNEFRRVELSDCSSEQDHFFTQAYDDDIRVMALAIIEQESPIRDDVLAKQIARAHGFARTGGKIRGRILDLLDDIALTEESTGRFLWLSEPQSTISFRHPASQNDNRSVDEISLAELCGLIEENLPLLEQDDPPVAIARSIGLARLSKSARDRLEEAISSFSDPA